MVFDRDDGVLEVGGDLIKADVAPLLVEAEPGTVVGVVKDGVADTPDSACGLPTHDAPVQTTVIVRHTSTAAPTAVITQSRRERVRRSFKSMVRG